MAKFKIIFKLEVEWFKYYIVHLRFYSVPACSALSGGDSWLFSDGGASTWGNLP